MDLLGPPRSTWFIVFVILRLASLWFRIDETKGMVTAFYDPGRLVRFDRR